MTYNQKYYRANRCREIWRQMKARCLNPKNARYEGYGGRGITICDRWLKFENFREDMGEPPEGLSLERRDNDAGYSKDNCYWATRAEQQANLRTNVRLTYQGKTQHVAAWAREVGLAEITLVTRLRRGWPVERALSAPIQGG